MTNSRLWTIAAALALVLLSMMLVDACNADTIHFRASAPYDDPDWPVIPFQISGYAHYNEDGTIGYARIGNFIGGKIATRIAPFGERGGHSWGIIPGIVFRPETELTFENSYINDERLHLEIMGAWGHLPLEDPEVPSAYGQRPGTIPSARTMTPSGTLVLDIEFNEDPEHRVNEEDDYFSPDKFTWSYTHVEDDQHLIDRYSYNGDPFEHRSDIWGWNWSTYTPLTEDLLGKTMVERQAYGGHSHTVPEPSALALLLTVIPLWRRLCPN